MKLVTSIFLYLFAALLCIGLAVFALVHCIIDAIRYKTKSKVQQAFFTGAYALDIYGNTTYSALLDAYFLKHGGYHFGNDNETVSSTLGKNWTLDKLTWLGQGCVGLLNLIDRDHCFKYIQGEWALPKPGRVAFWKTALFSLVLLITLTITIKSIAWLVL